VVLELGVGHYIYLKKNYILVNVYRIQRCQIYFLRSRDFETFRVKKAELFRRKRDVVKKRL